MTLDATGVSELDDIDGIPVRVDRAGSGRPTLLFVHGLACDRHDWDAQVEALASQYQVVTFDLPGHGASGSPVEASVEALARTACRVKERHATGDAVLVGHSLGCRIVLEAYGQAPAGIRGLVLLDAVLTAHGDADGAVATFRQQLDTVGVDAFLRVAIEGMFLPGSDPALRSAALARAARFDGALAEALFLSCVRWDAESAARALAAVDVPLLSLQSTYLDETFTRRSLPEGATSPWDELVRRHAPGAEVRVVSGVGHLLQVEAAETVNGQIAEFAGQVARR